jgi:polyhydroxybutyrate depolymerase
MTTLRVNLLVGLLLLAMSTGVGMSLLYLRRIIENGHAPQARSTASSTQSSGDVLRPEARTLRHRDQNRTYLILKPRATEKGRFPVILLLHPAASTGQIVWEQTSLPRIAHKNRVILVAPDGSNKTWNTHYWKSGGADDIGFLTRLIDEILSYDNGDPERIYVTGMSAGAGMTFALAWTMGDRLAAIGPVANNMGGEDSARPSRLTKPLPVIHIMGTSDPSIPYTGGHVFNNPRLWPVLSAEKTVAYWVAHNRCKPEPAVRPLPDKDRQDGSRVVKMSYSEGTDGAEVVHYRIEGGGHTWPNGPDSRVAELFLGKTTQMSALADTLPQRHALCLVAAQNRRGKIDKKAFYLDRVVRLPDIAHARKPKAYSRVRRVRT